MSKCTADAVIKIARGEVGYVEKRSASSLSSKTANAGSNNYTKYGKDMHKVYPATMDYPAPWCDCFVDWCVWVACDKNVNRAADVLCGKLDDYTVQSAAYYRIAGRWGSTPKVGAQIFFKNSDGICHTGLVTKVDDVYVHTIEGNTSGASGVVANGGGVAEKKYPKSYAKIAGYGYPRYESTATDNVKVDGTTYRVKTNGGTLNVREKPTTASKVLRELKNGSTINVYAITGDWAKTDGGYVHTRWIKKA